LRPIGKITSLGSVRIDKSEPLPDLSIRQEHYVATWIIGNTGKKLSFFKKLSFSFTPFF